MNLAEYGGIERIKYGRIVHYLCEAVIELTSTMPAEEITVKMLTAKADVSKQTFYNHFPDKYALFNYIFLHDIQTQAKSKTITLKDLICDLLPTVFENNIKYYQSVASVSAHNSFHHFLFTYFLDQFKYALERNYHQKDITTSMQFSAEIFAETACNCFTSYLRKKPESLSFQLKDLGSHIYDAVPETIRPAFEIAIPV